MTRRFAIALLVLYAAATLYLAIHHEPWRDEADSWLLVHHASLPEIFHWTRYAGTPALWYVLLKPLAWMQLPYFSQTLLHLLLAWSAAAVLLFCAPFSRLTKALFLASYYPIYEYSVIARSYVLTNLLLFIAAALYTRRRERPIAYAIVIALMFNANVHAAIIAATLALLFVLDRPRRPAAIAIMAGGAFLAFLQLRIPADAAFPHLIRNRDDEALMFTIGQSFLPTVPLYAACAIGIFFLIAVVIVLRHRRDALFLIFLPLAFFAVLYWRVWFGGFRHAGILLILVVAALWIADPIENARFLLIALNVMLMVSALLAIPIEIQEVAFAFSGSKEMGQYIRDHHLDRYEIAAHKPYEAEAVLPYLPGKQFWYAGLGEYGTYLQWDRHLRYAGTVSYDEAQISARRFFTAQKKPWLLLLNNAMPAPAKRGYVLLYATRQHIFRIDDEKYFLYRPLP
ncbi:MAG TPA: hypothetical protein VLV78_08810 [Thermoanaerobaculia bacterium]|nr:hypothetical protein [Thermoanaerobaculia bacterium]